MPTLTINDQPITVPAGATVLQAVRQAGAHLPTLCHWEGLPPYGACRLCLVEIRPHVPNTSPPRPLSSEESGIATPPPLQGGGWGVGGHVPGQIVAACTHPVEEGLIVDTTGPAAVAVRRLMLEFLLARCPTSTVIHDLAVEAGVTATRFAAGGRPDELCVLCGLCVRVCRDLVGAAAIGFIGRGAQREVGAPFRVQAEACIGCGACAAVCPTGAVKIEDRDGKRYLHTWNTVVELAPCSLCGQPFGPEPMAFLAELVETGERVWGVCPACRRKAAAAGASMGWQSVRDRPG